jgi:hypothetical protein
MDKLFELLKRASEKLQDYCTDMNGDLNDSLANEINAFIKTGGWRTDFENIPVDVFMMDEIFKIYTKPVLVTISSHTDNYVIEAYYYQYCDEDELIWIETGRDGYRIKTGVVLAWQPLPEPYNAE